MHSFKTHVSLPSVRYINVPTAHVFNTLKVEQSAFTQASFSSLSDIHEYYSYVASYTFILDLVHFIYNIANKVHD